MLAIIIPYYNFLFFEETLKSLSNQTDKRFNVYIGNDASPNNPEELLNQYKSNLEFNYYCFKSNLGQQSLVQQWDRCIGLTKSEEWLMLLGDDDILGANVVEEFYNAIETITKANISVVRYASVAINAESDQISGIYKHPQMELATDAYFKNFKNESRSSLSEYIFKREAYETYRFKDYPLGWYADDMAWLEFSDFGTIFTINSVVVSIRTSVHSTTGKSDNYLEKYRSAYFFFRDLIRYKPTRFTVDQRAEFMRYFELMVFKLNFLTCSNYFLIASFWLKRLDLLTTIRFTKIVLKRKFRNG